MILKKFARNPPGWRHALGIAQQGLLVLAVVVTPLAWGTVERGPILVFLAGSLLVLALWLVGRLVEGRLFLERQPADLALLAFLALLAVAAVGSIDRFASLWHWLLACSLVVLFALLSRALRASGTDGARRRPSRLALLLAGWGGLYATGTWVAPLLREPVVTSGAVRWSPVSTFVNDSHFVTYLGMLFWVTVGLARSLSARRRPLALAAALVMVAAVVAIPARSGPLALLVGAVVFLALDARPAARSPGLLHRRRIAVAVAMLLVVAGVVLGPARERWRESLRDPESAVRLRIEVWRGTVGLVADHPWQGTGPGTFALAFPRHQGEVLARLEVRSAHSDFLQLAAEAGLPTLAMALLALGLLAVPLTRSLRAQDDPLRRSLGAGASAACALFLTHELVGFNAGVVANGLVFVLCASLAVGCGVATPTRPWIALDLRRRRRGAVLLVSLLLVPAGGGITALLGAEAALHRATVETEPERALAWLASASRWLPIHREPRVASGRLLESMADGAPQTEATLLLDRARGHYDHALVLCPRADRILARRARVEERLGRSEPALANLAAASQWAPWRAAHHCNRGRLLFRGGAVARSLEPYRRCLELDDRHIARVLETLVSQVEPTDLAWVTPRRAAARRQLANLLLDRGAVEQGLREVAFAAHLDPSPFSAATHLKVLARWGDPAAGLAWGRLYGQRFGDHPRVLRSRAEILGRAGRANESEAIYRQLLERDPGDVRSRLQWAEQLWHTERADEAERVLRAGLATTPADLGLHTRLARLHADRGRDRDELVVLRQLVRRRHQDPDAHRMLARAYRRRGWSEHAAEALGDCLARVPEHPGCSGDLAELAASLGLAPD